MSLLSFFWVFFSRRLFMHLRIFPVLGLTGTSDTNSRPLHQTSSTEFHDMLRVWIGDPVDKDSQEGNGVAGLIAYLTDHMQAEQKGRRLAIQKKYSADYENYGLTGKEFCLKNPCMTTMLYREQLGGKGNHAFPYAAACYWDQVFFTALRRLMQEKKYKQTSWADIRTVFEQASGENIEWFFSQWVSGKAFRKLK